MALKKDAEFCGIAVPDSYITVVNPSITEDKLRLIFRIHYQVAPGIRPFAIEEGVCQYDLDGANPHTQAYGYLKTLPHFSGAVDC